MDGDDAVSGGRREAARRLGHELAVVTTAQARGRGLASLLIAQAGRRVLAEGALPTYLHLPDNEVSARVSGPHPPARGTSASGGMTAKVRSRPILRPSRMPRSRWLVPRAVRSTTRSRTISLANVRTVPRANHPGR